MELSSEKKIIKQIAEKYRVSIRKQEQNEILKAKRLKLLVQKEGKNLNPELDQSNQLLESKQLLIEFFKNNDTQNIISQQNLLNQLAQVLSVINQYEINYDQYQQMGIHIKISLLMNEKSIQMNYQVFYQLLKFINNMCVFLSPALIELAQKGIIDFLINLLACIWNQSDILDMIIWTTATFAGEQQESINSYILSSKIFQYIKNQLQLKITCQDDVKNSLSILFLNLSNTPNINSNTIIEMYKILTEDACIDIQNEKIPNDLLENVLRIINCIVIEDQEYIIDNDPSLIIYINELINKQQRTLKSQQVAGLILTNFLSSDSDEFTSQFISTFQVQDTIKTLVNSQDRDLIISGLNILYNIFTSSAEVYYLIFNEENPIEENNELLSRLFQMTLDNCLEINLGAIETLSKLISGADDDMCISFKKMGFIQKLSKNFVTKENIEYIQAYIKLILVTIQRGQNFVNEDENSENPFLVIFQQQNLAQTLDFLYQQNKNQEIQKMISEIQDYIQNSIVNNNINQ